jgi:hypothetical protein
MAASCVLPVGFYVGLSIRDSNDSELKEQQRIEILINERVAQQRTESTTNTSPKTHQKS